MKAKFAFGLLVFTSILLSSCGPTTVTQTDRQGSQGFTYQSIEGYSVEEDGQGGVYFTSPDQEIGIIFNFQPSSYYTQDLIPVDLGGKYAQESFPVETLVFLGYSEIQLGDLQTFQQDKFSGYRREFTASGAGGDIIQGEYIFFPVGDHDFIAMGTVVHLKGNNQWDPQGKQAFDTIIASLQFDQ